MLVLLGEALFEISDLLKYNCKWNGASKAMSSKDVLHSVQRQFYCGLIYVMVTAPSSTNSLVSSAVGIGT